MASGQAPVGGATASAFILPMFVCLGSMLFLTSAFVALSPPGRTTHDAVGYEDEYGDDEPLDRRPRPVAERQGSHA